MTSEQTQTQSSLTSSEARLQSRSDVLRVVNETMRLQSQRIDELAKLLNAQQDGLRDVLHTVVELVTAVQALGRDLEDSIGRMEDAVAALIVIADEAKEAQEAQGQQRQDSQSAPSARSRNSRSK